MRLPQGTGPSRSRDGVAASLAAAAAAAAAALHIRVTGVVQGVGFRPFVHRLAARHGLCGWVRNDAGAVTIRVEGSGPGLQGFVTALRTEAPVLARLDSVERLRVVPEGLSGFRVLASAAVDPARIQPVPPDVAVCDACLEELFDPRNRRYRYPFITCTDCGPRFTVIEAVPYERARTSMRRFPQCPACQAEFETPVDRRFHSETNSCPACGPRLWFEGDGRSGASADPLERGADLLSRGGILAVRGLGGFHLAVDATDAPAVARLRERKHREAKPLAVMVRTVAEAAHVARVGTAEAALLVSAERPIVLLDGIPGAVAPGVHPGLARIGVMLAYTPVHHLLLDRVRRPLVMTSGNLAEEPIAAGLEEARQRLGDIADGFLVHDREIVARCDDSVVRPTPGGPILLRRARGYAPLPLTLPVPSPRPLLAVGPHLKNTATLVRGRTAFVTPHIGDLDSIESLDHFEHLIAAYRRLFHVEPRVVVRDLHPEYLSTRIAAGLGLETVVVQHHHAHIAAVLAEHGRAEPVIGVAYDGTGFGDDGAVWGAEVFVADLVAYRRLAHLRYAPLPGGDLAARRPWRAALGYLTCDLGAEPAFLGAFEGVSPRELEIARVQAARGLNAPPASSMGRLFDAAAAVLGVRREAFYEGQAAMELEALAGRGRAAPLPFPVRARDAGPWELDPLPLLVALGEARAAGREPSALAAAFHESVAAATADVVRRARAVTGLVTVALGGGVFQNARLLGTLRATLEADGFRVLTPGRLGPNDGAISFGQAAVAAARLREVPSCV